METRLSTSTVVNDAEQKVKKMLTEQLTEDHKYHNLSHTLAVRSACRRLGEKENLSEEKLEILELAALFHDVGFSETYNGHEDVSHRIAQEFLEARDYPQERRQQVLDCIDVTFLPNQPETILEKIIRDADLINLGSDGYMTHLQGLRHEWKTFLGHEFEDSDWYKMNRKFLKSQDFFTEAARELYGPKLRQHQKQLKKLAKRAEAQEKKAEQGIIHGSKSAQMMFKTALRNHLDLSTLADNKANIMLSVNALIITIIVPMAAGRIVNFPYLLWPVLSLLATCLASMIFATLATRPIRMMGKTSDEDIQKGQSNLFFFGNFYQMRFQDYKKGILAVLSNEEDFEDTIVRDLFFLGRSLGTKYRQLRLCYTIFMSGVVLTVIIFLVAYSQFEQLPNASGFLRQFDR